MGGRLGQFGRGQSFDQVQGHVNPGADSRARHDASLVDPADVAQMVINDNRHAGGEHAPLVYRRRS